MLDAATKARIDSARDILVGKVPDPKSQVEHAAWEVFAENTNRLRSQIAQGIDGERVQDVVDLLDQVTTLLNMYARKKRRVSDIWPDAS